jgi:hypothetical protein
MNDEKKLCLFLVFIPSIIVMSMLNAEAALTNSSNYQIKSLAVSSGGQNASSGNYKTDIALGVISGITNSSLYKFFTGFWYTGIIASAPIPSAPSTHAATPSGGGGGAGPPAPPKKIELKIGPESIKISATAGITTDKTITIENTGETEVEAILSTTLQGIIKFTVDILKLQAGEKTAQEFTITPPKEPGVYTGKIIVVYGNKRIEMPIILNVKSEKILFDVSVDIPDRYINIEPGDKMGSQITLVQVGPQEKADVLVNYAIKDFEGETLLKESETIMVSKQKSYAKEFDTQNLPIGSYILGVEVIYLGGVATASAQFNIQAIEIGRINIALFGVLMSVVSVFIAVILAIKRYKKVFSLKR